MSQLRLLFVLLLVGGATAGIAWLYATSVAIPAPSISVPSGGGDSAPGKTTSPQQPTPPPQAPTPCEMAPDTSPSPSPLPSPLSPLPPSLPPCAPTPPLRIVPASEASAPLPLRPVPAPGANATCALQPSRKAFIGEPFTGTPDPYFRIPFWPEFTALASRLQDVNELPSAETWAWLLTALAPFAQAEPTAPVTVTQRPEPLEVDCTDPYYAAILTGKKRAKPVKVFSTFPVGAEFDLLEIRLWSEQDVVDQWIIVEETVTQKGVWKPLTFQAVSSRYFRWHDRIVRLINDDSQVHRREAANATDVHDWSNIERQRSLQLSKIRSMGIVGDDDILVWGDLDEFVPIIGLAHLKQCEPKHKSYLYEALSPMFMGRLNECFFHADFTPKGDPLVFRFPLTVSGRHLKKLEKFNRTEPPSKPSVALPGGLHLSDFTYPPYLLLKFLSLLERVPSQRTIRNYLLLSPEGWTHMELDIWREHCHSDWPQKYRKMVRDSFPWVLQHNPDRWPEFTFPLAPR